MVLGALFIEFIIVAAVVLASSAAAVTRTHPTVLMQADDCKWIGERWGGVAPFPNVQVYDASHGSECPSSAVRPPSAVALACFLVLLA
jgi:hypothetical protein